MEAAVVEQGEKARRTTCGQVADWWDSSGENGVGNMERSGLVPRFLQVP